MANVSRVGARVNGNPPEADYGSNQQGLTGSENGLLASSFWLPRHVKNLRVDRRSTSWKGLRGWSGTGHWTGLGNRVLGTTPDMALGAAYGLLVPGYWHESGMYTLAGEPYLFLEQTWGRAVRASHNSRELGALLIWGVLLRRHASRAGLAFANSRNPSWSMRIQPTYSQLFAPKLALYIVKV